MEPRVRIEDLKANKLSMSDLDARLKSLEGRYDMLSSVFYRKYNSGNLVDLDEHFDD